jgi:hypothetical protein
MAADVQEGPQLAIVTADDQQGLTGELGGEILARLG